MWCRFCTLIFIVRETTLVYSRTLSFCFLLIASRCRSQKKKKHILHTTTRNGLPFTANPQGSPTVTCRKWKSTSGSPVVVFQILQFPDHHAHDVIHVAHHCRRSRFAYTDPSLFQQIHTPRQHQRQEDTHTHQRTNVSRSHLRLGTSWPPCPVQ